MTIDERARRLVGDMPWVTEHLTPAQRDDLYKQIGTSMHAAAQEAADTQWEVAVKFLETHLDEAFRRLGLTSAGTEGLPSYWTAATLATDLSRTLATMHNQARARRPGINP